MLDRVRQGILWFRAENPGSPVTVRLHPDALRELILECEPHHCGEGHWWWDQEMIRQSRSGGLRIFGAAIVVDDSQNHEAPAGALSAVPARPAGRCRQQPAADTEEAACGRPGAMTPGDAMTSGNRRSTAVGG